MTRIVYFDVETRRGPEDLRPDDREAGWDALRNGEGGISAMCVYDSRTRWLHTYDDNKVSIRSGIGHLESADVVVGFCSKTFDVPCIEGILGRNLRLRNHIDMYSEIAEETARRGIKTSVGDLKLDSICRRNLGRGKTNHGSHASQLTAEGRFGELFNYCGEDVRLTKDLFTYICTHNGVHSMNKGWLTLTVPQWIREAVVAE